jgi:hypothetical protein
MTRVTLDHDQIWWHLLARDPAPHRDRRWRMRSTIRQERVHGLQERQLTTVMNNSKMQKVRRAKLWNPFEM